MAGIKVNREGGAQTRSKAWHPRGGRLRTWLADHRRVALETSLSISRRIFGSLLVWLMIGVALAMPGLLWMLQSNLQGLSQQWQGSTGLTIYMALGASEQSLEEIATVLEREPSVIRFQLTTPQQALDELLAQSSESDLLRQAIAEIEANPLPASFGVILDSEQSYLAFEVISRQLSGRSDVEEVVVESLWLERLRDLSRLGNRGGSALITMLLAAAVLVSFATIRLAIDTRLAEMRVLALIGATRAQLRRPFLYLGSAFGLGGGMMAIFLIAVFLKQIEVPLESLLVSYGWDPELSAFTPQIILLLLTAGWLLGIAGALLALIQRLGVKNSS